MNDIRKACVEAIFRGFEDKGGAISPACGDLWDEIEAELYPETILHRIMMRISL